MQQCASIIIIISMKEHFSVELQPVPGSRDDGVIRAEDFREWKHHNPSVGHGLPGQRKVFIIIMIREIRTRVAALSEGSYEIFPYNNDGSNNSTIGKSHKCGCEYYGRWYPQSPFPFPSCSFCGSRPSYHHGRCCPMRPRSGLTNLQKLGLGRKSKRFEAAFHSQGI